MSTSTFPRAVAVAPVRLGHPGEIYVGGAWVSPAGGGRIEVVSPSTEEVLITVAEATEPDMDAAVAAARAAFDQGPWTRLSYPERAEYLRRLAAALREREPRLARAWVDQTGALAVAAPFVIRAGTGWFDYYADLAATFPTEQSVHPGASVFREPVGVVAAIAPWNNPYGIMTGKIAPALLAGCTVVMKPAPETPVEAHLIAEAADEIGLPPGVLNLVPAHRDASDHLVRNPGVDKVSFTGSVAAGQHIASVCGDRLARYTLELGGKSAAIVLDDYDIEDAADTLVRTITASTGQVCATLSRVVVSTHRRDALADAVRERFAALRVGDPFDPATDMGPLSMTRQRDRVESYIEAGRAEGATLAYGGGRPTDLERGFYVEPTLFTDVEPGMRIAQEEIFGPVLSMLTCTSVDEAVEIANDSAYGLYGAVFTHDEALARGVARRIRAGTIAHNGFRFDPSVPFGGFKHSGVGREGGLEGLLAYTEAKSFLTAGETGGSR
ncbi:aldehyde dehydrogenase [Streptomyces violarus]|uniref:aldehyde dehydrogenase n=1 Tax=Streptomyces violarus TaxID=67380 RepID=UPI0021C130B2|nr:aldehyde dehydrogenase [Streptomyces violarus]MCT9137627.1 aldehyde dehydrogenase [Streptomyces violarus]